MRSSVYHRISKRNNAGTSTLFHSSITYFCNPIRTLVLHTFVITQGHLPRTLLLHTFQITWGHPPRTLVLHTFVITWGLPPRTLLLHRQFHTLPGLLDSWAALPNFPQFLCNMRKNSAKRYRRAILTFLITAL